MPIGICKLCFKPIAVTSIATLLFKNIAVCDRCFDAFAPIYATFKLEGIQGCAIYGYDDFIKEQLYLFKGCCDYERKDVFFDRIKHLLHLKYFGYSLVTIPSWHQDDERRGFNHVVAMFKTLKRPMLHLLSKTRPQKQAELNYAQRQEVGQLFAIADVDLRHQKILLVDDVMTSGASLRAAIALLKTKNPKKIQILVMAKTKLKDK